MPRTVKASLSVLLFALAVPAFAGGGEDVRRARQDRSFLALLWEAVSRVVPLAEKSRGSMDPNGSPAPSSPSAVEVENDARGSMDPNG
jgi:hypothetical protein